MEAGREVVAAEVENGRLISLLRTYEASSTISQSLNQSSVLTKLERNSVIEIQFNSMYPSLS